MTPLQSRVIIALGRWVLGQVSEPSKQESEMTDDEKYAKRIREKWTAGKRVSTFGDLARVLRPTPKKKR